MFSELGSDPIGGVRPIPGPDDPPWRGQRPVTRLCLSWFLGVPETNRNDFPVRELGTCRIVGCRRPPPDSIQADGFAFKLING